MQIDKKHLVNNLAIAFLAQGISLILSFIISFIVPKMLSLESFSYWQLFIFYISYVGFSHFGINDGVYLRYGGEKLKEMNKKYVSGQFQVLCFIQLIILIFLIILIGYLNLNYDRKIIFVFTLIYMLIFNLSNYLGYIFQAANLTRWYSYSVMIDKIFFLACILILLIFQNENYMVYITLYLLGKILCLIYCIYQGRSLIFIKIGNYKPVLLELKKTISVGIKLTISAMSSMLILGVGRFLIDANWGIEVFGKISFSLSLTTFILAFISQVSMVLFPMLRRIDKASQMKIYEVMRLLCFFVMPLMYLLMIPGRAVLNLWLPNYNDSLLYLSILLPICVFDAKMNMIFNTFFKVLRMERVLLFVNIVSLLVSIILSFIGIYIFDSYLLVIVSMVISIMFRSVLSEYLLGTTLSILDIRKVVFELLFAFFFMIVTFNSTGLVSFFIVSIVYFIQVLLFRESFKYFFKSIIIQKKIS